MSKRIRRLDEHTASQIAAGEVVERPASVVKELVENALDAGARRVVVELEDGGKRMIAVTDDGEGMEPEDAVLALERHTTSKLSSIADLDHLTSLGFRGEALPSIASVARVEVLTRTRSALAAAQVRSLPGEQPVVEAAAGPPGTRVVVRELFAHVPARAKFLKSAGAEAAQVALAVSRLGLAFPAVSFRLVHNGRPLVATSGSGRLREVITELWGPEVGRELAEVEYAAAGMAVRGCVGRPVSAGPSRRYQLFFVNRRWTRTPLLRFALDEAYQGILPAGQYAPAVVFLKVEGTSVDVNVHPAKWEVRFRDERAVRSAVTGAVRSALGGRGVLPVADRPAWRPGTVAAGVSEAAAAWPAAPAPGSDAGPDWRLLGQLGERYLLASDGHRLWVVDQHAAAERVCYQRLLATRGRASPQGLLEPEVVELAPEQLARWEEYAEELGRLGFEVEVFGPSALLLRTVPSAVAGSRGAGALLRATLDRLEEGTSETMRLEEARLALAACHGSVRSGQVLSPAEQQALLRSLAATAPPYVCPHGRPVVLEITREELDRRFGR